MGAGDITQVPARVVQAFNPKVISLVPRIYILNVIFGSS